MNSIHARPRLAHRSILFTPLCLAAWFALMAGAASASDPADEQGTLMLVRKWDPSTGELVGWLPTHCAAMRLTILGDRKPAFDLNEPVTIEWLPRREPDYDKKQVFISPEPRVFEGERWVPAKHDGNVVRIAKHLFLIRSIIFGDSQWRRATRAVLSPKGNK